MLPSSTSSFLATLDEFQFTLGGLEASSYLTTAQVNRLLGLVFFGAPGAAATCIIPLTWKAQIIIGLVAVVIGGIVVIFSSAAAALRWRRIRNVITSGTATNAEIDTAVDTELDGLDDDDKQDIIDALSAERDKVNKDPLLDNRDKATRKAAFQRAIDRLQESMEGD